MVNRRRGEIEAQLDGRPYTLCLTLGALAELENAFGAADLIGLAERFEQGRIAAGDALKIIAAGLRGGGHTLTIHDVGEMRVDGGAAGYVRIVAELLAVTFGVDDASEHSPSTSGREAPAPRPRPAREAPSRSPAPPSPGMK